MNITTATPVEIDTVLAEFHGRWFAAYSRKASAQEAAQRYRNRDARYFDERNAETMDAVVTEQDAIMATVAEEMAPLDAEFTRRGGWTRAFLVQNSNGHVHKTMACGTCYPSTQFAWVTEYSGRDEAEVVTDAGEMACTVCYPTAPAVGPCRIEMPEKRAAREARDTAKAKRDADRAAKAITDVDGSRLRADGRAIDTLYAARGWLTDAVMWNDHSMRNGREHHPSFAPDEVNRVAAAVAAKEGKPVDHVMADAAVRASKRK